MPKVTIVIPAYNAEKYIAQTIDSVLCQSYSDWELVVVDDGSKDSTLVIVKSLAEKDWRIKVVSSKNGGVSLARNLGIERSSGEFLAFLDADDIWLSDNLTKKVEMLMKEPTLGLVHSSAEIINAKSILTGGILEGIEGYILDELLAWKRTCIPGPSSILIRKELIEKVGGFDPELSTAADQDFFIRVAASYKIGRVSEVTWQYRIHENNMHANILLMEHDELLVYRKAKSRKLFKSKKFERNCFSRMYLILSGSWWVYEKNFWKASYYYVKAFLLSPSIILRK